MIAALATTGAALAQAPIPPPSRSEPIIDCARRIFAVDSLVCDDPKLLAQSRRVDDAYRRALAARPDATLTVEQEAWAKQRNACVFKSRARRCVEALQAARLRRLSAP